MTKSKMIMKVLFYTIYGSICFGLLVGLCITIFSFLFITLPNLNFGKDEFGQLLVVFVLFTEVTVLISLIPAFFISIIVVLIQNKKSKKTTQEYF